MTIFKRHSAVQFDARSAKKEERENWSIVLQYQDEGQGPWLVDLAHKNRFDLQDKNIGDLTPGGITVPATPGSCALQDNTLINRMNGTQASIYNLGKEKPEPIQEGGCTEVTEATVFLALFGPNAFLVAEKLTALDFLAPDKKPPFLYQGPFCHVPCQIVIVQRDEDGSGGILLSCSRGYAESLVHAVLDAGGEFGLRPAGEDKFTGWIESL